MTPEEQAQKKRSALQEERKIGAYLNTSEGKHLLSFLKKRYGWDESGPPVVPGTDAGDRSIQWVGIRTPIKTLHDLQMQSAQRSKPKNNAD